jgi:hypothetical protein
MNETVGYVKRNKPDSKSQMSYAVSHMQNLFIFQRHESLGDNQGRGGDQWEGGEETKECKG